MIGSFPSGTSFILTILGILTIGSVFAVIGNSAIDRIPKHQSVIQPGPYCRSCAAKLLWYDLIPVWSYTVRFRGKCPYCGSKMPTRNLVVDLAIMIWIGAFVMKFGWSYEALLKLAFGVGLITIFVIQMENRRLSTMILLLMMMLSMVYVLAFDQGEFPLATLSLFVGAAILLLYNVLKIVVNIRPAIDFSEVEFGAILGLFLGLPQIMVCVFLAVLGGAVLGSLRIKFMGVDRRTAVPDFPMLLATSGMLTLLFGPEILSLYKNLGL